MWYWPTQRFPVFGIRRLFACTPVPHREGNSMERSFWFNFGIQNWRGHPERPNCLPELGTSGPMLSTMSTKLMFHFSRTPVYRLNHHWLGHRYQTPAQMQLDKRSWRQNGVVKQEGGLCPAVEHRYFCRTTVIRRHLMIFIRLKAFFQGGPLRSLVVPELCPSKHMWSAWEKSLDILRHCREWKPVHREDRQWAIPLSYHDTEHRYMTDQTMKIFTLCGSLECFQNAVFNNG